MIEITENQIKELADNLYDTACTSVYNKCEELFGNRFEDEEETIYTLLREQEMLFRCIVCGYWVDTEEESEIPETCCECDFE